MYQFLYHYYESIHGPFANLSALSPEEAHKVQDRIRQRGDVFASKRPADYLVIRRQLEERARDIFISKGGKPVNDYPHYMTIGPCDWLKSWYKDGKELSIPIEQFDPKTISFTYGDLFPTMRYKDEKPYREKLYLKDEIVEVIEEFGWPQEWNRLGDKGPERYIEVQIWDDEVVSSYKLNGYT